MGGLLLSGDAAAFTRLLNTRPRAVAPIRRVLSDHVCAVNDTGFFASNVENLNYSIARNAGPLYTNVDECRCRRFWSWS